MMRQKTTDKRRGKAARQMGNDGDRDAHICAHYGRMRRAVAHLIGGIAALFLTGAFTLGLAIMGLAVARMQEVRAAQLFDGFKNYGSSLALFLLITIFTRFGRCCLSSPASSKRTPIR